MVATNKTSVDVRPREFKQSNSNHSDAIHKPEVIHLGENPLATIVLPAFNEETALPSVLNDLQNYLDNRFEVIVVDDGSSDETPQISQQYACRLIQHQSNFGKGAAMKTGLKYARGDYVVFMDADGTYPVSAIPQIVNLLEEHDLVRCTRDNGRAVMPWINRFGNHIFNFILSGILRTDGNDQLSGLYGLHRLDLLDMNLESNGFDIESEICLKASARNMQVATFPIDYQNRVGEKKLRPFQDGWRILRRILFLILIFNPGILFIIPGLIVMALGISGAVLMNEQSRITTYFGLDIHSFILATLGILSGFQLVIFGMAAALLAVEAGYNPRRWLVYVSSVYVRMGSALVGVILVAIGFLELAKLSIGWLGNPGPFTQTHPLITNAAVMIGGFQLLSAALFLSIFAGKLKRVTNSRNLSREST